MKIIERQIKRMQIGPGLKKTKNQFFIAGDELLKTIKSIYKIRKVNDPNWMTKFQKELKKAENGRKQDWEIRDVRI